MIPLALLDDEVPLEEKDDIAAAMLQCHIPELQMPVKRKGKGKPIFPCVSKPEFFLSSLVGPDCWYCFKLFAISHDFLEKRASQWNDDKDFTKSKGSKCCCNK